MKSLLVAIFLTLTSNAVAEIVHHELKAQIDPKTNLISAEDTITLSAHRQSLIIDLHSGLEPSALTKGVSISKLDVGSNRELYGVDYSTAEIYEKYSITLPPGRKTFTLKYQGKIDHSLAEQGEEYARSFSETPGIISEAGCYLSGSTVWYPQLKDSLITYELQVELPQDYDSVSGGNRSVHAVDGGMKRTTWTESQPQDDITLVCGKYNEYSASDKELKYYVFLREPDDKLAGKYLKATQQYVRMYSDLIGPYPYGKFALVENFWETGYGIPSFTLLGPKVVRFPFILNSSYPHEILHNWWGNGVYVDYEKGNWCEGLTAYLADYLISENRGKGREYRMSTLQKYTDYVRAGKDFPLSEFRSRRSSASEAIGYGKALMAYHMLRLALGEDKFRAGIRDFYLSNKFKYASFEDLKRSFEKQTGKGRLDKFFNQWIYSEGAPELKLKNVRTGRDLDGAHNIEFTISQEQAGLPYQLEVPVAIFLDGVSQARISRVMLNQKEETYKYSSPLKPVRIELDPEFDIFRKLDPMETPPTMSRILGAERPLFLLPASADPKDYANYESFARTWNKDKNNVPEIKKDSDLTELPQGRSVWILGRENKFTPIMAADLEKRGAKIGERILLANQAFPFFPNTFVFSDFNPSDPLCTVGLILPSRTEKLPLLASKLPHYGKYAYLVFDGAMNSVKSGFWEADNSPLSLDLAKSAATRSYPPREPLMNLPSPFSADRMRDYAEFLSVALKDRSPGAADAARAAEYISLAFQKLGLLPFTGKSYAQEFTEEGRSFTNILGYIPGGRLKNEYVVLSAHYDHLPSEKGLTFPGANDNASGVALLLELAGYYARQKPERSVIFAAFSGEELQRIGSKHFVKALDPATINADINLDSVGRLNGGKMLFLNADSSDKWAPILRGAGFVTGADHEAVRQNLDSSDQMSFIEAGIPGIQLFSGTNMDYHKPTDTADKLDYRGMVKEAEFLKEIVDYLANESDLITRPAGKLDMPEAAPVSERKAATGLVPSFDWQGTGVRADSIIPDSPLAKAGVKAGDVLIRMNNIPTEDLRAYSRILRQFKPGDRVKISYVSDNVEKTIEIELAAK